MSTPSATGRTVVRLLWAVAIGLIALEIAAEATGQQWSFALPSIGRGPAPKAPYVPLYAGQAPAPEALPGVFGAARAFPSGPADRAGSSQTGSGAMVTGSALVLP